MDVPPQTLLDRIVASDGPVLFVGASDTGKTTLVSRMARTLRAAGASVGVVDGDVGQSEVGPPGMLDLAYGEADVPLSKWRTRGHWYVGAASPYGAQARTIAGLRRLCDRAASLSMRPVLVDTPGFVDTPMGHAFATSMVEVLAPGLVVAVSHSDEMDRWLRGSGVPVERVLSEAAVRVKPSGLRSARRAARLAAYFHDATAHAIRLNEWAVRGTHFGFGQPMSPADKAVAAKSLGCPVVHGEQAGGTAAVWTLGPSRRDAARTAAELGARRVATFDASLWQHRSVGFIAPDGFCLAMGVIEKVDWPSLTATVIAPVWSVAEAVALTLGTMRHKPDGTALPPVPDKDT